MTVTKTLPPALYIISWRDIFPEASVVHLTRVQSDHASLLIRFKEISSVPKNYPFRFQATWFTHVQFSDFIKQQWDIILLLLPMFII